LAVDPDAKNSNLDDETLHLTMNNLTMTTYDCVGPLADALRANNVSLNHLICHALKFYNCILRITIFRN